MSTKKIPLNDATASELADFAAKNLGLDVNFRMGADKIRATMATTGYAKDFIEVDVPDAVEPNARQGSAAPAGERKYITVLINAQEGPGGSDPVPVSLNGKAMLIARGIPQRIPAEYISCLKDAVKKHYDPDPKGGLMPPRDVPTYQYSILQDVAA